MSLINIPITNKEVFGGTKTLVGNNQRGFTFSAWQTKDLLGIRHFFFNNSSAYPVTAVGTGTFDLQNGNRPVVASLSDTVFSPTASETARPLTTSNQRYVKANIVANDDGIKIVIGGQDLSKFNIAVLLDKSSQISTAGKLKIRTSVGNESVCAFTTSTTANTWIGGAGNNAHFFDFQTNGANGVAHTGTFDASNVTELEVTGDTSGTDICAYEVYFCESVQQAIGYELTIQQSCVDAFSEELSREMSDILCNQVVDSAITTGDIYTLTMTFKRQDLKVIAMSMGDVLRQKEETVVVEYDQKLVVSSNTASYPPQFTNVAKILNGKTPLDVYYQSTDVPSGGYYDDGAGTITVSGLADGTELTLFYYETKTVSATVFKALEQGFYGYLAVPKVSENGKVRFLIGKKVQIMITGKASADDGSTVDIQFKFYADNKGVYVTETEE